MADEAPVAVITGGTRGIGLAVAKKLAAGRFTRNIGRGGRVNIDLNVQGGCDSLGLNPGAAGTYNNLSADGHPSTR